MKTKRRLLKSEVTLTQELTLFRLFASWSKKRKLEYIRKLPKERAFRLKYTWQAWARDSQLAPEGDWSTWLLMAGRGFGKTRCGAEWVIEKAQTYPGCHIALVGRTVADVRDVMIRGRSGILSVSPPWFRPRYIPSKRLLIWPNGSYATTYSADSPDQLRGPQHSFAWADERAAWQYDDAWDQLQFGLRIEPAPGVSPQCVVTTTPRNTKAMKELRSDPSTVVTKRSTYENRENLSKKFIAEIERHYAGKRLGRQEIEGDIIDDIDGALWKRDWIERNRVDKRPGMVRIVVAVDPPASSLETSDDPAECGICVAGIGTDGHGYMLADYSLVGTPNEWGSACIAAYTFFEADVIVGEVNNGGEMVGAIIKNIAKQQKLGHVAYKAVRASRGKQVRAEPISDLAQGGQIHHVGCFPDTEDQLCFAGDTLIACEQGWKRIDTIEANERVWTRQGLRQVIWSGCTNSSARVIRLITENSRTLIATMGHPVYNKDREEFVPLGLLQQGDTLEVFSCQEAGVGAQKELMDQQVAWGSTDHKWSGMVDYGALMDLMDTIDMPKEHCCIGQFGKMLMGQFQKIAKFITRMETNKIIGLKICNWLHAQSILPYSIAAGLHGMQNNGHKVFAPMSGKTDNHRTAYANTAAHHSKALTCEQGGAHVDVVASLEAIEERIPVYNLDVEGCHEYYAHGILVHNCNWVPGERSPDRLDAHVWAFTELMVNEKKSGGILSIPHKTSDDEEEEIEW